jgi:predicted transcriptional regulator
MTEPEQTVSLSTLNKVAAIDEFKGRWESQGQLVHSRLRVLQRIANMESSAAAGRLMGNLCSDRQIGEFLAGRDIQHRLDPAAQEIITGFHKVLKLVNDSYDQVAFIESHVLQMRDLLLGNEPVVTEAVNLPGELGNLIQETHNTMEEGRYHPLLVASAFSFRFWHLRLFPAGSRRLTWLLTRLLLLRKGYSFLPYGSLEHFIETILFEYQKNFADTATDQTVSPNLETWQEMFLDGMLKMQENILAKIRREKELIRLNAPHLEIIRTVQEQGQSTISKIMASTNMNRNTLKVRLRKLVAEKYLIQNGRGKSTYYILPELHLR